MKLLNLVMTVCVMVAVPLDSHAFVCSKWGQALKDRIGIWQTTHRPKGTVIMVDVVSTASHLPVYAQRMGYRSVHVQTLTDEAIRRAKHWSIPLDRFAENFVWDRETETLDQLVGRIKSKYPDIQAVLAGCEFGVAHADKLGARLGLPGNSAELADARRDKLLLANILKASGIRAIKHVEVEPDDPDALRRIDEHTWVGERLGAGQKIVVKPSNSAATDKVFVVDSSEALLSAVEDIKGAKGFLGERFDHIIIQEFIEGDEYVVNTMSTSASKGPHTQTHHFVTDMWVYHKEVIQHERGESLAYRYNRMLDPNRNGHHQAELIAYVKQVLDAMGMKYGPVHMEVFWDKKGPVVVDFNARLMGASTPVLSAMSSNVDAIEWTLLSYLNPQMLITKMRRDYRLSHIAYIATLLAPHSGKVAGRNSADQELRKLGGQLDSLGDYAGGLWEVKEGTPVQLGASGIEGVWGLGRVWLRYDPSDPEEAHQRFLLDFGTIKWLEAKLIQKD